MKIVVYMTDKKLNRRNLVQLTSAGCVVALAGCSDIIGSDESDGADGADGADEFKVGDDEVAMITLDYFTDDWEVDEDPGEDDDDIGDDDEPEWESGTSKYFFNEDEGEGVFAGVGIAEDADAAEKGINDWVTANIVGGESVDLGDGGERGEVEGFAAVGYYYSNAGVFSMAAKESGLDLEPMHGRAYNVAEDLLENLQDL